MHRIRHRSRTSRTRRGVVLLEFVLTLPMFLFMMLFVIDIARVMMVSGAVQDATYRAARAGATYGAASTGDVTPSNDAFEQALDELPGGSAADITSFTIMRGEVCTASEPYVEIQVAYSVEMVTPGLGALLNIAGGDGDGLFPSDSRYQLTSTAIARCEVAS